jgi:hypothetical protein
LEENLTGTAYPMGNAKSKEVESRKRTRQGIQDLLNHNPKKNNTKIQQDYSKNAPARKQRMTNTVPSNRGTED